MGTPPAAPGERPGAGTRARAGGDGAPHSCPRRRCRGAGGRSAAAAREESSRLVSGCLADAKCVSGQQEEGRGSESSGSRRRSSPPARSVSACAPASASGRGWARGSRTTHAAAAPGRAAASPAPRQGSRVARAVCAWNPRRACRCPTTPGRFVKFPVLARRPDSLTSARPGREQGPGRGAGVRLRGTPVASETLLFPPWGRRGSGRGGRGAVRGGGSAGAPGRSACGEVWAEVGRAGVGVEGADP